MKIMTGQYCQYSLRTIYIEKNEQRVKLQAILMFLNINFDLFIYFIIDSFIQKQQKQQKH